MDAVHELAEQNSDEMRAEIASTRSDLADQLEALEDRVMGTVESAQETVEDSIQIAKDTVAGVKRTFDITHHVEQYPWVMVGGSVLAGVTLGALFHSVWERPRQTPDRLAGRETAFSANSAPPGGQRGNGRFADAPLPQHQSPPPSEAGLFELFHDEIAKVKGMAIGYAMGLARDAIKDAAPQWASQIDGVMNSVTTKLGGAPVTEKG